jgi:hypothetical protein
MAQVQPHGGFFQAAWVVDDLDGAIMTWVAQGVGPFYVVRHAQISDYQYRGTPAELDFSVAMAQAGAIQIELIQQHDGRPSHYRDSYAPGESGFHHMCRFTADIDTDIAALGAMGSAVACRARSGDMRFAYVDTRHTIGCMTELIEDRASIRGLFDLVARGAEDWDGRDPIREVA